MFTLKNNPNKECETWINFNITEPVQTLQSICSGSLDKSVCSLDRNYLSTVFKIYSISDTFFQIPVRYQITYDCSTK